MLLDLRKTISECIADNYFSTLQALADTAGVEFTAQAMGNGQSIAVDNIAVKGRMRKPQGEFWAKHKHGSYDIKEASSAAHIYGRHIASAEAYTDMNYGQTLAEMKNLADFAYANQLNEFVVCASAYQPWTGRIPGNTAGGRQYCLNRNNPYWEYSRGFWDYQARCAAMMRLGRPENALCIYLGDNPPLKLQTYRLPEIPPGYEFDVCSSDGLLGQTFAKDGRLCTKSGMEYGMLVIEDKAELPEDVRAHIEKLRHGGVPVCFGKNLAEALDSAGVPPTVIEDSDHRIDSKIYFAHRILADADMFFINNHSARAYDGRIAVRSGYSHACWWNPVDGSRKLIEASADGRYVSVDMLLQPGESGFIVTSDRMPEGLATREYRPDESVSCIEVLGASSSTRISEVAEPSSATPSSTGRSTATRAYASIPARPYMRAASPPLQLKDGDCCSGSRIWSQWPRLQSTGARREPSGVHHGSLTSAISSGKAGTA